MRAARVVEREVTRKRLPGLGLAVVRAQVKMPVLDALPQSPNEPVVRPSSLAVHADRDAVVLEHLGEVDARELTSLVGVEEVR